MPSIIIPAHNESAVIEKCLSVFIEKIMAPDFEVIVVCNGCIDDTALITRKLSDQFICIETEVASKTHAINLGEKAANFFPRIYLDADIILSIKSVNALCGGFNSGYLAMSLMPKMNMKESSWPVRAYYDIWLSLPYCKEGMMGAGIYALSKEGRERFKEFPNIIADDGFVRCMFMAHERGVVSEQYAIVNAPKTLKGLIKIKTRSRFGGYELQDKYPELMKNEKKDYSLAIRNMVLNFEIWPKLFVYVFVNFITRLRAKLQYKKKHYIWERDETSR